MRRLVALAVLCAAALTTAAQTAPSKQAIRELAPTGRLRVAINYVNTVIAHPDAGGGEPQGISADLARELARRLGVPIEYVIYEGAGREFHAADHDRWDIGFFAINPERAKDVDFTSPYIDFAGGYMVRQDSPVRTLADVDKPGVRIAVGKGSVYDLFLTGTLEHAELVRITPASLDNVVRTFAREHLDVAAFIRLPLLGYAKTHPEMRIIHGGFMDIEQAIASPRGHGAAGLAYLRTFVGEAKMNGFLAAVLGSHHPGVSIAPGGGDPQGGTASLRCELLPPSFRSDLGYTVLEKVGPAAEKPTGNTYFLMPRPYKSVVVHLNPLSSDNAPYLVKLITRYADDTIYEPLVEAITPRANTPFHWGPLPVMPPRVPKDKAANMFNVKVQENYTFAPDALGFTYTVSVEGCD
jgi:polar amino acid transport system substrate-binding protein